MLEYLHRQKQAICARLMDAECWKTKLSFTAKDLGSESGAVRFPQSALQHFFCGKVFAHPAALGSG